jgi:hypothetical protein
LFRTSDVHDTVIFPPFSNFNTALLAAKELTHVFTRGPGVPSPPKAILGDKISQNMRNHHQLHQLHQLPAVRYQGFVSFILLVHNSGKNE